MNIFFRTRTAELSKVADAMAFAEEISALAGKIADVEILAWTNIYGDPMGTMTWTYRADSLAATLAVRDRLLGNAEYMAKVQDGNELFTGPVQDVVAEVIHVVGSGAAANYSQFITAQCQPGRIVDAMTWAGEIQEESSRLTGLDGVVIRSLYGPFASVGWITPAATIDQIEKSQASFTDPTFAKSVDRGGELFIPGNTVTRLSQRIA